MYFFLTYNDELENPPSVLLMCGRFKWLHCLWHCALGRLGKGYIWYICITLVACPAPCRVCISFQMKCTLPQSREWTYISFFSLCNWIATENNSSLFFFFWRFWFASCFRLILFFPHCVSLLVSFPIILIFCHVVIGSTYFFLNFTSCGLATLALSFSLI